MKKYRNSKKSAVLRGISLVAVIATMIGFTSCGGVDPNVKQKENNTSSYQVVTTAPASDVEKEGFNAYGDGLTDPVKLKGVTVKVSDFAVRSFELAFLLGSGSFKNVEKLPVDMLTQYGFSHLSYKNLYEIPKDEVLYREADEAQIQKELKKHFGSVKVDLKKSSLYNKGKKKFEIWLPNYGTNVYYRVDAADVSKNKVEIITTFYNELKKSSKLGRTTLTVKLDNKKPVIAELKVG